MAVHRRAGQPGGLADDDRQAARRRPLPPGRASAHQGRRARARPRQGGARRARPRRPGRPHRGRRPPAGLPVLPPVADAGVAGRADATAGGWADHRRDRARLPRLGVRHGPADLTGQEDAHRGPCGVRDADGVGAHAAPRRRHGRDLPDLQRGLHRHRRGGLDASRPGPGGDPAGAPPGSPRARRAGGARPAGAAGAPGVADGGPDRRGRHAGPARGAGPHPVGPAARAPRPGGPAHGRGPRGRREAGRQVLPAGPDRRAARPRRTQRGHRLAPHRDAVRRPRRCRPRTGRGGQPGRRPRTRVRVGGRPRRAGPAGRRGARRLGDSALVPSVRGDLLERAGRYAEAAGAFTEAASRTRNDGERALLLGRASRAQRG